MINHKGFSAVIVLLSILVLTAIGFTGYYVWNTQQEDDQLNAANQQSATLVSQEPTNTNNSPVDTQKYLVINEWGVVLNGIESSLVGYTANSIETMRFVVPYTIAVSDECRELGIGITRVTDKNILLNPDKAKFIDGYYYSISGSPSACNDDPASSDYKTHQNSFSQIYNNLETYSIVKER